MSNKWISVETDLPKVKRVDNSYSRSEEVVVLIGDERLIASLNNGNEDGGWENWYCRAYEDCVDNVTHWAKLPPLPSPPDTGEK